MTVTADVRAGLGAGGDPGLLRLTARELDVLRLMAEGRSNGAIAARVHVTYGAVEKHVASIFAKLGLPPDAADHRRVRAVLRYLGDPALTVGEEYRRPA